MRILMFGRGVIATIYGQVLQAAGHDVEFYVRRGRAAAYGDEVQLDLVDTRSRRLGGRVRQVVPTRLRESVETGDGFELVLLSVGHHQLPAAAEFLAPRIGDATVLVFGNIWDEPIAAVAPLPSAQVVFGFPQAGGGFGEDGVLHGGLLGSVIVGTSGEAPSLRESAVQEAFRTAGLAVRTQRDMRGWLWLHFVADAGMHAEGLRRGGLAAMIGDRQAFREALLTSRELLPVLQARGIDLRRHRRSTIGYHLSAPAAAGMAWASVHVPIARASLAAHTDPEAAEPRAVLRDTVHEARRLGVPAPRLEASLQLHP